MIMTSGNQNMPGVDAQRSTNLKRLIHRSHTALVEILESLLSVELRQRIHALRRDRRVPEATPATQLTGVLDDGPGPIPSDPPPGDGETRERELVPLPDERSQALAVLCDRLLQELNYAEAEGAEIRFVVHKREHPGYPRLDPRSLAEAGDGELVWELRRLIAWSGGTIADVAQALETRGADLDERSRELLRDEIETIDSDLATLSVHLADPLDWDSELECLLAGELAPFDDFADDEDNTTDD
jgi:hypothetical protein